MIKNDNKNQKWVKIAESLGVNLQTKAGRERAAFMAEIGNIQEMYARSLNENVAMSNLSTTLGMGPVVNSQPNAIPGRPGTLGSGDIAQNLVPVAMKIAAQTIGLDLVPVKPAAGPKIDLAYLDYKYDDADLSRAQEKPQLFQVPAPAGSSLKTFLTALKNNTTHPEGRVFVSVVISDGAGTQALAAIKPSASAIGTEAVSKSVIATPTVTSLSAMTLGDRMELEFIGFSRIEGNAIFRAYRQNNNATSGLNVGFGFDGSLNTFPVGMVVSEALGAFVDSDTAGNTRVAFLVPVTGVTGATTPVAVLSGTLPTGTTAGELTPVVATAVSVMEDNVEGFVTNWNKHSMPREQDERFYPGLIAPDLRIRTVQIGSAEVSATALQTEIEDIKAATGIDIIQKLEGVLVNEMSQAISKEIVKEWKRLCAANRNVAPRLAAAAPNFKGGFRTAFDLDINELVTDVTLGAGAFRTSFSDLQRKLVTKLESVANYIVREGRIGRPTHIVTNERLAAALVDNATNAHNPWDSSFSNDSKQLYPVGTVKGMTVYVDPYMENDNSLYIGRKNNVDQPGLVFVPYLMAQSLSIISEQTRSPRLFLRSRYTVVELGFFPYKQYMEVQVYDPNNFLA